MMKKMDSKKVPQIVKVHNKEVDELREAYKHYASLPQKERIVLMDWKYELECEAMDIVLELREQTINDLSVDVRFGVNDNLKVMVYKWE